ncbi:LOW QUALITY PROTEIN: hypothetical protein FOVG_17988 [Fusarium oxysporum f. sp. pisi HDV247]|uniref:Uncharacterized protein n=1 Tax=Fusarium oxysporum f. sp. pisi HDV247 TaxID=1080344 RepID=W9ND84_FUSOX|nr:LOW QUALITY PROTEIN: hypothetical protein FOVG_17988 [Fusarium oxysporum f. sp. pisi HDV247]
MEGVMQLNEEHHMLLCRLCKSAVRPGPGIESHFRHEHQLKGKVLKEVKNYYEMMELANPKFAELQEDGSVAVELVDMLSGYSCAACITKLLLKVHDPEGNGLV